MRRTDVLKAREILWLKNEFGFSIREIARASRRGKTTVSDVLERAVTADLTWLFELNDKDLMSKLYPPTERAGRAPQPIRSTNTMSNGLMVRQFLCMTSNYTKSVRGIMTLE